ncbi:MAG: GAF domain-containing protein [Rubripirellula sp.]
MIVSCLPTACFLSDVRVYDVSEDGFLVYTNHASVEQLVSSVIQSGQAEVSLDQEHLLEGSSAVLAIPVLRSERVISVAVLSAKRLQEDGQEPAGVFEVWQPTGEFQELSLTSGFFAHMDRFQNVSSFVRFEKGSGLPGQVWQQRQSVIHDDLPNHPGFLRAAGASADSLATAIGIPVATKDSHCSTVLISSQLSPMARGFETWRVEADGFRLKQGVYGGFEQNLAIPAETFLEFDQGLVGAAREAATVIVSDDLSRLFPGRDQKLELPSPTIGLAIPFFEGDKLSCITTLLI